MKKIILSLLMIIMVLFPILSDPISLETEITTVSFGPHGFGMGLAPTGTNFMFYDSFKPFKNQQYNTRFKTRLVFWGSHSSVGGYNYETGTPRWANHYNDIKDIPQYYLYGEYFNPGAYVTLSLSQGFGMNPVEGSGSLIDLGFSFNSRFSKAYESLDVHRGSQRPLFINPETNTHRAPFGPDTLIPAYPWLQDNRNTLVNSMEFTISLDLSKSRGFGVSDGLYMDAYLNMGPSWMANNVTMNSPTSDYYEIGAYIRETLTLYSKQQQNGWNWLTIQVKHANSLRHIGGTVIPANMIPTDRLENQFSDSLTIEFNGPQFIAWDCYTDFTLGLYNNCYFGHVVNESSKDTYAVEWKSYFNMRFHMRLFGFMHFSYDAGYDFYHGIHMEAPGFYQNAKVTFYISL